ncbi:fibronectin type III domain-containing protein [Paenibacillus elgii]|uniref:fibronectin type III domain-containing protein n=1 Tax=Paenibacillus elgii TaxID=189691 RepID=UPI0030DC9C0C
MKSNTSSVSKKKFLATLLISCLVMTTVAGGAQAAATSNVTYAMFDDFNYTSSSDSVLTDHQWSVKTGVAGPGPVGGSWSASNITFVTDPDNAANKLLRLTSSTDGTPVGTSQAEILTPMKYFEGTYAARVKFSDTPVSGVDGDGVAQTFFTISNLRYDNDPTYSELDYEYLVNGGWGVSGPTLWTTSWYTYSNNPWSKDNVYNYSNKSYNGWHTLVLVVKDGQIKYFADGALLATHSGKYYPRANMAIDFNQWFLPEALMSTSGKRSYQLEVDWVYHAKNTELTPVQVEAEVQNYRSQSITHTDNVTPGEIDTQAPTAPANLVSTIKSSNSISLVWNASSDNIGVTGYDVYQNGNKVLSVSGTTLSATVTGLSPNTSYTFMVKAKDAAGNESSPSNTISVTTNDAGNDTQAPSAPGNLVTTGVTSNTVSIAWGASSDNVGVTGYDIYQNDSKVFSVSGTTLFATVTGLSPNTSYRFTVKAKDAAGNQSPFSNSVSVTTNGTSPVSNWEPYHSYALNDLVIYEGKTYKCLIAHTSQVNWIPSILPTLWQLQPGN